MHDVARSTLPNDACHPHACARYEAMGGCVYILTNIHHTVFYVGVTSDLEQRLRQHRFPEKPTFAEKYNCTKLVYFEVHECIEYAIKREKFLKGKKRSYKLALITQRNPEWRDLIQTQSPPAIPSFTLPPSS